MDRHVPAEVRVGTLGLSVTVAREGRGPTGDRRWERWASPIGWISREGRRSFNARVGVLRTQRQTDLAHNKTKSMLEEMGRRHVGPGISVRPPVRLLSFGL